MIYAGFWKRFMSAMLDFLVLVIPVCALNFAIPYAGSVILAVLYYPVFESSSLQATPGKFWMGLKVMNENGQALTFPRACARFFLKYVSTALLMVGYLIQLFTAKRQTLHDIITDSVVVEHQFPASVDWIKSWMKQMRFILRLEPDDTIEAEAVVVKPSESTFQEPVMSAETTTPEGHSSAEAVQAIEKLYELYKNGALTEDEFQSKKSELLKQV